MKTPFNAVLACLAAACICGCASHHAGPVYHAGDENPPDFLVGPVALVLTNLNGFSAHISSTITAPGGVAQTNSGELLGREGRLVYQPTLAIKGKRARTEGGLFFIWDQNKRSGYVLSEALQAYAPVKTDLEAGTRLNITKEGIQENINGHPCHRCEALVVSSNGLQSHLTLWRADDAGHFPIRIQSLNGPNQMTLNFTEVRLEYPGQGLFLPPDGFTSYPTSIALMNELIIRDSSLAKKYQFNPNDEPAPIPSSNWHDPAISGVGHP